MLDMKACVELFLPRNWDKRAATQLRRRVRDCFATKTDWPHFARGFPFQLATFFRLRLRSRNQDVGIVHALMISIKSGSTS